MEAIVRGSFRSRSHARVRSLGDAIVGSGACAHPDGVVRLMRSALEVFDEDLHRHLERQPCSGSTIPSVFKVPGATHKSGTRK
jgi:NADH:ubiquinone oxidoreductase subunit F (NADH-binding)